MPQTVTKKMGSIFSMRCLVAPNVAGKQGVLGLSVPHLVAGTGMVMACLRTLEVGKIQKKKYYATGSTIRKDSRLKPQIIHQIGLCCKPIG